MNLNSNDLSSMGHALGLNEQQISQIQQNIQASQQPAVPGMFAQQPASYLPPPLPSNASVPSAPSAPPMPVSTIEAKFQQLDSPFVTVTPPTPSNLTQFGYSTFMSPGIDLCAHPERSRKRRLRARSGRSTGSFHLGPGQRAAPVAGSERRQRADRSGGSITSCRTHLRAGQKADRGTSQAVHWDRGQCDDGPAPVNPGHRRGRS